MGNLCLILLIYFFNVGMYTRRGLYFLYKTRLEFDNLSLFLVLMLVNVGNPSSHKYDVEKQNKIMAFFEICGYSCWTDIVKIYFRVFDFQGAV